LTRVLHIHASPRGQISGSGRLAEIFLDEYRRLHPDDEVETLSLFECDLPEFGFDETTAKFAPIFGDELSDQQQKKWAPIVAMTEHIAAFDKIVLSTPMWNFSIPYRLKHYIDILVQPLLTFGFNLETGEHFGLLQDRPLQFILTRSSVPVGDPFDFQLPYLKAAFAFMGLNDQRLVIAPTTTRPTAEARKAYIESFADELRAAAHAF
jgi:FMN-dependent NADH-azoreductase